ncbi:protein TolR [Sphingomonas sp. HITSZ_GF]|uniref:protein TolR n=1 Tax=Sphingomonas sp. HITSZ_GF TaxID=3037247 RepID=UPI00240DDF9D|nr:protein TolR [Sphingomonas sp. HITSZ_GF]MDG2534641.1 protein TolR [Sphingomonas sp. HITSZ_GF]
MAMHLPSNKGRGRRAPMAEINVTPLVDVMLVLLIIFMVTAPLLTAGVPVNLPESRAKPVDQDQKPVQISIDDKGQIFIDDELTSDATLSTKLEEIAGRAPGPDGKPVPVFLRADQGLGYGKVMKVMGELNHAGLNRVSLITDASSKP